MKKNTSGFTIVELLIVIVVIATLAAITIVAYNGIQTRATSSSIATGLKDIDKSLHLYAVDKGWSEWPRDNAILTGDTEPTIQNLADSLPGFDNYMQAAPSTNNVPSSNWKYDNDGDTKPATCWSRYNGTNIMIQNIDQTTADAIDAAIDDGSDSCAKIRYDPDASKLFYSLSLTSAME